MNFDDLDTDDPETMNSEISKREDMILSNLIRNIGSYARSAARCRI